MLAKTGTGAITFRHFERALLPKELQQEGQSREEGLPEQFVEAGPQQPAPTAKGAVQIDGADDMLIKISQCCKPVPGDEVIGFITTGVGISVHKADCPSLLATDPTRWVEVNWSSNMQGRHRTELFLRAEDRKNLLTDISSLISSDDADVVEFSSRTNAENIAEFRVVLEITDTDHLQKLLIHLQQMPDMIEVRRR
jgi:GTP pyrophosphokinase